MKRIIICDIDVTIAEIGDRANIINNSDRIMTAEEYDEFNRRSAEEPCIENIANIIRNLKDSETKIYLITAREEKWARITNEWIKLNDIPCDGLYMRENEDKSSDADVKMKIVKDHINVKKVWFVLEDRPDVVQMYRDDLGLTCLQVNKGDY